MRIAVVYPEVLDMARYREKRKEFPPFGALYIAAVLEEAGHQISVFKLNPFQLTYDFTKFDVIAFSISASACFNLFIECRFKSQIESETLLIAGGVHANLMPEQTLVDLKVDVVGVGEGEQTILDIIRVKKGGDFSTTLGVCYLRDGVPHKTPPRMISRNIDNFPFPARHLIDVNDFIMSDRMSNTNVRMTHLMPGRGCPFPCRYCASAQTKIQYRSGGNIRLELAHLIDTYGIQGFAVVGNDFILSKKNVREICSEISDLKLSWATLTRVDRVDNELLAVMRKGGCYELEFGVESGSQRILDRMDKCVTVEQVRYALRASYEVGIHNKVFLVHGFPGENWESTRETMQLLDEVRPWIHRVSLFRFVPLPGTYVYKNPHLFDLRGIDTEPDWDGDWGKYHIHHNQRHWWGSLADFSELNESYRALRDFVEERWPSRFSQSELPPDQWELQSKSFMKVSRSTDESEESFASPLSNSLIF